MWAIASLGVGLAILALALYARACSLFGGIQRATRSLDHRHIDD